MGTLILTSLLEHTRILAHKITWNPSFVYKCVGLFGFLPSMNLSAGEEFAALLDAGASFSQSSEGKGILASRPWTQTPFARGYFFPVLVGRVPNPTKIDETEKVGTNLFEPLKSGPSRPSWPWI